MKFSGFLLIVAMFFLGGCAYGKPREEVNLIAQAQTEPQTEVFEKPLKAAFLVDVRGELYSFDKPEFAFTSERAYISPDTANIVFFYSSDVTWSEFLGSLGVKIENNCLAFPDETVCPEEDEQLHFVINSESKPFDSAQKIQSGDRLYIGVIAGEVSRETLAQMPDPWMGEE